MAYAAEQRVDYKIDS